MNAEKTKIRTAQLRADLSEELQRACDVIEQALTNAAKLRLSAYERENLRKAVSAMVWTDFSLNR